MFDVDVCSEVRGCVEWPNDRHRQTVLATLRLTSAPPCCPLRLAAPPPTSPTHRSLELLPSWLSSATALTRLDVADCDLASMEGAFQLDRLTGEDRGGLGDAFANTLFVLRLISL